MCTQHSIYGLRSTSLRGIEGWLHEPPRDCMKCEGFQADVLFPTRRISICAAVPGGLTQE